MSKSLSCAQVNALLCFYVEDKLTVNLKDMVTRHLAVCKKCKDKYDEMLEIYKGNNIDKDIEVLPIKKEINYKDNLLFL